MLSKPSSSTRMVREHYATRLKRELQEEKVKTQQLFAFLSNKGLVSQFKDFTVETEMLPVPTSSASPTDPPQEGDGHNDPNQSDDDRQDEDDNPSDEPSDDNEGGFFTDKTFTVFLQLNAIGIHLTKSYEVKPTWQLKMLKALLYSSYKVKASWIRFINSRGDNLFTHLSFVANNVKDMDTIVVQTMSRGGGKRGSSSVQSKNKESLMNELQENMGMKMLRISNPSGLSPVIDTAKNKVLTILNLVDKCPKTAMTLISKELNEETLSRVSSEVVTSSTRALDRCRTMGNIMFGQDIRNLENLATQKKTVNELLFEALYFAVLSEFGDTSAGNISWQEFQSMVSNTIKEKMSHESDDDIDLRGLAL